MSISSKADESPAASGQAGFTLVEALVALVVAGLMLAVLSRALAGAWASAKAPMDVVSAVILARDASLGAPLSVFAQSRDRGFVVDRASSAADIVVRRSRLAPAFSAAPSRPKSDTTKTTPSGMQLPEAQGIVQSAANAVPPELRQVGVVVRTPLGRVLRFDTLRLDHVGS